MHHIFMSDRQKIEELEQRLVQALTRIGQLESKVQTMRANINTNLNGHTDILKELADHCDGCGTMHFSYVDVAEG